MRPERTGRRHRAGPAGAGVSVPPQAGFAAITAIIILVIFAILGAAMLTISGTRHISLALDVLGSRGYQAARSGIEWGAYQVLNPENTSNPTRYDCTAPITTSFALAGELTGFTATVSCHSTDYTEHANTIRIFRLQSTACNKPSGAAPGTCPPSPAVTSIEYVERQVTAVLETCRRPNGNVC